MLRLDPRAWLILQRIALCTVLAAPIVLYFGWRAQLAWIAGLLAFYSVLMLWVPVPGGAAVVAVAVSSVIADCRAWWMVCTVLSQE